MQKFQVLGDSYARRFTTYLDNNAERLQLCCTRAYSLSGATVAEIKMFLMEGRPHFESDEPLLLMLGVNDVLRRTPWRVFKGKFTSLIRYIRKSNPRLKMVIMQVPYFPKAMCSPEFVEMIRFMSNFFHSFQSDSFKVLRTDSFLQPHFYQRFYGRSSRPDLIHFNDRAHRALAHQLLQSLNLQRQAGAQAS